MGLLDTLSSLFRRGHSPARTARLLIEALERRGIGDAVYDAGEDEVRLPDVTIYLGNLHSRMLDAPAEERPFLADEFAASIAERNAYDEIDFAQASAMLLPRIDQSGFQSIALLHSTGDGDIAAGGAEPFIGDLTVRPIIDTPNSMIGVTQAMLELWQTDHATVAALALENLQARRHGFVFGRTEDGLLYADGHDGMALSAMLVPEIFDEADVPGDVVVMPASRDALLIAGTDDARGLAALVARAEEWIDEAPDYPCTPHLYRLSGDDWLAFTPQDPDLALRLRHALRMFGAGLYGNQKQVLDQRHEADGTDIFVASCSVVSPKDAESFTYSTWSEGVDAMLPQSDRVIFGGDNGPGLMAGWDLVRQHAGHLMTPVPGLVPPRWRVRDYPDKASLEAMAAGGAETI